MPETQIPNPVWPRQVDRWLILKPGYITNPLLFVYHVHPNLYDGLRNAKYCYFSLTNPGLTVELNQSIWKRYMGKKIINKWSTDINYFQGTGGRRKLMNSQVDFWGQRVNIFFVRKNLSKLEWNKKKMDEKPAYISTKPGTNVIHP